MHQSLHLDQFVMPNQLEILTAIVPLPVNVVANAPLQARGGTGVYSWSVLDPLPTGVTFSATGKFAGTPTTTGDWPPVRVVLTDAGPPLRNTHALVTITVS